MTKKQKKTRNRIIAVLIMFAVLLVLDKTGVFENIPGIAVFVIYFVPYLIIGYDVIRKAATNIRHGQVFDENFLMMIATFGAFAIREYSEALAVMLFYQVGELFQSYAVGKSRQSIADLMSIAPEYANLLGEDGNVSEVDPSEVNIGDVIVIKPGEKVPLDGVVIEGSSFLDTSAITGESVPRRAEEGTDIYSGCINKDSVLKIRATKKYEDSTVAKILELVENASNKKSRMENFITRFARYYTPVVTIGAVLLAILPPLFGQLSLMDSVKRACIFLIVSCPCALVISVPLGFFGGIGASSRRGILVKGSNFLEAIAEAGVVVMDKTGTLTKGEFKVNSIVTAKDCSLSEDDLLKIAAHIESFSTHPIAKSVQDAYFAKFKEKPDESKVSDVKEIAGHGIMAKYEGKTYFAGNEKLMQQNGITSYDSQKEGTVIYVSDEKEFFGTITISDTIKEGAADAIDSMKKAGVKKVVMLTGDSNEGAKLVADKLHIDDFHAQLLPADKVEKVETIISDKFFGKVVFVGDGINDAPVLMRADVGVAMGSLGSDAAIEAADIVLMDDDIRGIPLVIEIARKTVRIVKENIVFALAVKILILILGALGIASMWFAVFGDVGVAVIAILNSMRTLNYSQRKEGANGKIGDGSNSASC